MKKGRPKIKNPIIQKSFSIRCPMVLYDQLEKAALSEGRMVSAFARRILELHLNK